MLRAEIEKCRCRIRFFAFEPLEASAYSSMKAQNARNSPLITPSPACAEKGHSGTL